MRLIGAEHPDSKYRRYMWTYHTVHLHGNELYVLKIGYPKVENNIIRGLNENIRCLNSACTKHGWNENGLLQQNDFESPVRKNTILIPAMGRSIIYNISLYYCYREFFCSQYHKFFNLQNKICYSSFRLHYRQIQSHEPRILAVSLPCYDA